MFEALERTSDALFVRCLVPLDRFLWNPNAATGVHFTASDGGQVAHNFAVANVELLSLVYNATLSFVAGPYRLEEVRRHGCAVVLSDEGDLSVFARFWNVAALALDRWAERFVPLGETFCSHGGAYLAGFYAPFGETVAEGCLALLHNADAVGWAGVYTLGRFFEEKRVVSACLLKFFEEAEFREKAFMHALPTMITALLDPVGVQASGFVGLPCAETTHRNHIYSGSLKSFIFANEACNAVRDLTCPYVDVSECERRISPCCRRALGDAPHQRIELHLHQCRLGSHQLREDADRKSVV